MDGEDEISDKEQVVAKPKKKKKQPPRLHDLQKQGLLDEKQCTEEALDPFKARVVSEDMYPDRQGLIAEAHNSLNEARRSLKMTRVQISPQMTEVVSGTSCSRFTILSDL